MDQSEWLYFVGVSDICESIYNQHSLNNADISYIRDFFVVYDNIDNVLRNIGHYSNSEFCFVFRFKNKMISMYDVIIDNSRIQSELYKVYSALPSGLKDITNLVNFS